MYIKFLLIALVSLFICNPHAIVSAQENQSINDQLKAVSSLGVATYLTIKEPKVEDGDVITFTPEGYILAKTPYDQSIVGVVSQTPAVSIQVEDNPDTYPVVPSGNVSVKVSSVNGPIAKGDLLTTSEIPGVAMKSTKVGFVLGTAIEDYNSSDPKAVGKIPVSLNIHYFYSTQRQHNMTLTDLFNVAALSLADQPSAIFRYIMAGLVMVTSIVVGYLTFAKVARNGLEALGRNPLAGKMIQFGIMLNVGITVAIVLIGGLIAFLIIRL
jgi:hypothetical protein